MVPGAERPLESPTMLNLLTTPDREGTLAQESAAVIEGSNPVSPAKGESTIAEAIEFYISAHK